MIYFSIALCIWLGIGLIGGMRVVLYKEFWEVDLKAEWEEDEIGKIMDYPKYPKLFFFAIHMIGGPYWIYRHFKK